MDGEFANKTTITKENLRLMLDKSADLYGQLRFVHLSAHLDTMQMLTTEQAQISNRIRGYDSAITGNSSSSRDNSIHEQHLLR